MVSNVQNERGAGFPVVWLGGREILEVDVDQVGGLRWADQTSTRKNRETDADLVKMRVRDGMTYEQIAVVCGLSKERVRQIIVRTLHRALRLQFIEKPK